MSKDYAEYKVFWKDKGLCKTNVVMDKELWQAFKADVGVHQASATVERLVRAYMDTKVINYVDPMETVRNELSPIKGSITYLMSCPAVGLTELELEQIRRVIRLLPHLQALVSD